MIKIEILTESDFELNLMNFQTIFFLFYFNLKTILLRDLTISVITKIIIKFKYLVVLRLNNILY